MLYIEIMFLLSCFDIIFRGYKFKEEGITDTEILKSFIVMAESESISQAARKMYIAQSALSNRLKALEKECGAELIERDYHKFRLTQSGRFMYERAMKIVELAESTAEEIRNTDSGLSGVLNIAATPSLATGVMRDWIKRYRETYGGVEIRIYESATPDVIGRLQDGICEIALVRTPFNNDGSIETQKVGDDRMAVLSVGPMPESIDFADMLKYPLILTHRHAAIVKGIAAHRKLTYSSPVQCEEIATCIAMCEMGLGATMIPHSTYINSAEHGSRLNCALLADRECDTVCVLARMKNRRLSAAARNFADIVTESR